MRRSVFGEDKERVVRVISGQAVNWGVCELHIDALGDKLINPKGTKPERQRLGRGAIADPGSGRFLDERRGQSQASQAQTQFER